jgi:hypothetical protein
MSNVPTPGRHGWAELLRLVDELTQLAFDKSIDDADRARGFRDTISSHRGEFDDHDDE